MLRRPNRKLSRCEMGVALMMTMWALVLLSVIAMSFAFSTRLSSAGARNFKEDALAYSAALAAYDEAIEYLLEDMDPDIDYVDDAGEFRTDSERQALIGVRETEELYVSINISDESSRLNINLMRDEIFRNLLRKVSVPEEEMDGLVDSLNDWKDPDDLHRLSGAEDEYYLPLGYIPANRGLEVPSELTLIKGFNPDYYYGGGTMPSMHEILTTWADKINVNTASKDVLEIIGINPFDIDSIMNVRAEGKYFRSVPASMSTSGSTKSSIFRINVTAIPKGGEQKIRLTSIVKRPISAKDKLKTLYWKEDIENSRA